MKQTNNTLLNKITIFLKESKQKHHYCDDNFYSCPMETESGCCDESQGDTCNCGASERNRKIESLLKAIKSSIKQQNNTK